ncbi:hypothetical protein ACJQWK_01583 [Exserohilum turcicum]
MKKKVRMRYIINKAWDCITKKIPTAVVTDTRSADKRRKPSMCILIPILLIWAISTLASPMQALPELSNITLLARGNPNACPANKYHHPTVSEWENALNLYCERHTPTTISTDSPLVYTYLLNAWDNRPILWIFKVWIDAEVGGHTPIKYGFPLGTQQCKDKFMAMVTQNKGGGMPKVYCEYEDGKWFLGGSYKDVVVKGAWARAIWESRQMRGDRE